MTSDNKPLRVDLHIHQHPHTAVWVAFIVALIVGWHFGG